MVIEAVMLRLAALATVNDCWLVASSESAEAPILPGATHAGLFTNVPLLLFPEESAAVLPLFSSNLQFPTSPAVTSPVFEGVAAACAELALSPPALTAA